MAVVTNPIRRAMRARKLRRLLALRRAWQEIVDGPDPDAVSRLASDLSLVPLPLPRWQSRLSGLPADLDAAVETSLRQSVLVSLYPVIQPALLLLVSGRAADLPIPAAWRGELARRGLPLRNGLSSLRFGASAMLGLARGMRQVLRTLVAASGGSLRAAPATPYDVAVQLPAGFLRPMPADPRTVFVDWLAERSATRPLWLHTEAPRTAVPGRDVVISPLPDFPDIRSRIAFGLASARLCLGAGIALLTGRPELAVLLGETIQLAHARAVGPRHLARTYVFENSRWFLRPLFTRWAAREAGSQAVLAFYSTNMDECIRLSPRPTCFVPGYQGMDWDRYLVWDDHQADLVAAWGHGRDRADIVGPIPLTDCDAALPAIPPDSMAIFDVAPFAPARLASLGLVPEYYRDTIAARFLDDIREAALRLGVTLVLKQKRERADRGPPLYEAAISRMLAAGHVIVLDPRISATRVIAACRATVSMPFSSPSLISAAQGKPAAFYDPTERLVASQRQAHGLPVIRGRDALDGWMRSALRGVTDDKSGGNE